MLFRAHVGHVSYRAWFTATRLQIHGRDAVAILMQGLLALPCRQGFEKRAGTLSRIDPKPQMGVSEIRGTLFWGSL